MGRAVESAGGPSRAVETAGDPSRVVEIACDESGSEGEKLVGGNTDMFAHASVRIDVRAAERCLDAVRERAPSPTTMYKSSILRRSKHRWVVAWLLGPSGPLLGHAHVHLIDKPRLFTVRLADLLTGDPARARRLAAALGLEGPRVYGAETWTAFLASLNDLLRARNGRVEITTDAAYDLVESLRPAAPPGGPVAELMDLLLRARPRVEAFGERAPGAMPVLDPLIAAIVGTVAHWGRDGARVRVVHDRQTILTDDRIAELTSLAGPLPGGGRLDGFRLAASASDARIQVADLLAGAARQIAESNRRGGADPELTALLRPYTSFWGFSGRTS
ncbi:hypothetical protein [Nonomuraea roseoviolacea]|uniref:DUF3800 domain-containing protein n=1 Tax=Nonomuraea roseoviolacea subsp. carminata TaxID=160689 RepID=A0ABT1K0E5_9ACTN|nr:hypothetical protein [Nonomuraea roseoviolacea]MCP2347142.1 hypothetical protein [Nonomuraea roseoviolacea subsp. carminata]